MARAAKGKFGIDVIPEYGLFPRGLIELYHSLQALRAAGGETEYVMTVSAVELRALCRRAVALLLVLDFGRALLGLALKHICGLRRLLLLRLALGHSS